MLKRMLCTIIIVANMSINCMEPPNSIIIESRSVSPDLMVKYLSRYIFNRESDSQFEKLFVDILTHKKNPKLYPELITMREHIVRELEYRIKG